jgi:hypothetical protein
MQPQSPQRWILHLQQHASVGAERAVAQARGPQPIDHDRGRFVHRRGREQDPPIRLRREKRIAPVECRRRREHDFTRDTEARIGQQRRDRARRHDTEHRARDAPAH